MRLAARLIDFQQTPTRSPLCRAPRLLEMRLRESPMPQIISCPDCRRKLRVPDNLLGKKVKCPGCGVKFVGAAEEELDELEEMEPPPLRRSRDEGVTENPSKSRRRDNEIDEEEERLAAGRRGDEEAEDDEDAEPQARKPKKREIYKGWERVRLGIHLVIVSIWISVCGFVGLFAATVLLGLATAGAPVANIRGVLNSGFGRVGRTRQPRHTTDGSWFLYGRRLDAQDADGEGIGYRDLEFGRSRSAPSGVFFCRRQNSRSSRRRRIRRRGLAGQWAFRRGSRLFFVFHGRGGDPNAEGRLGAAPLLFS